VAVARWGNYWPGWNIIFRYPVELLTPASPLHTSPVVS
jgi:hypothetical protein